MPEPRKPTLAEQLAAVTSALVMAWYMMPPEERYWAKLRFLSLLHRLSGKLARLEGRQGMGDELAGRDRQRYPTAFLLSRLRDRLAAELEDMRP